MTLAKWVGMDWIEAWFMFCYVNGGYIKHVGGTSIVCLKCTHNAEVVQNKMREFDFPPDYKASLVQVNSSKQG